MTIKYIICSYIEVNNWAGSDLLETPEQYRSNNFPLQSQQNCKTTWAISTNKMIKMHKCISWNGGSIIWSICIQSSRVWGWNPMLSLTKENWKKTWYTLI